MRTKRIRRISASDIRRFGKNAFFIGFPRIYSPVLSNGIQASIRPQMEEIAVRKLSNENLAPKLKIEIEIPLSAVNENLLAEISLLAPFGQHNPQPKFFQYHEYLRTQE